MSARAIELDGVGKRYRLGEHHGTGTDLRETLPASRAGSAAGRRPATREFWSLRDVSFSVDEGTALGIIGSERRRQEHAAEGDQQHHDADRGREPHPWPDRLAARGRHRLPRRAHRAREHVPQRRDPRHDRSGRCSARLDEIVEFAGLERFMDTPVKRYSSGMYLRLGFAIAAHMEAEILLVDEVLAVGDVEFQRRCLGKMNEVERAAEPCCSSATTWTPWPGCARRRCGWTRVGSGRSGRPSTVIAEYMQASTSASRRGRRATWSSIPTASAQVVGVALVDDDGVPQSTLTTRSSAWMQVDIVANEAAAGARRQLPWSRRVAASASSRRRLSDVDVGDAVEARAVPGRVPAAADPDPGRVHDQHLARNRLREHGAAREHRRVSASTATISAGCDD